MSIKDGPILAAMGRRPRTSLWIAAFVYTVVVAAFIQCVALPLFAPSAHGGHGLLAGSDGLWFHYVAVGQAQRIHAEGWHAWRLRPTGQAPAGIASAVYALTVPEPWTMIPLNAALGATAVLVMMMIVRVFVPSDRLAAWCVLPALLYPSAMMWNAQLHKDSFFITGCVCFLYGWVRWARRETWQDGKTIFAAWVWSFVGTILIWIVRPYMVHVVLAVAAMVAVLLTVVLCARWKAGLLPRKNAALGLALMVSFLAAMAPLPGNVSDERPYASAPTPSAATAALFTDSPYLPHFVNSQLRGLAFMRWCLATAYPEAGSNIDTNLLFHSPGDVLAYIPRATQVVFFSPFPNTWRASGGTGFTRLLRGAAAVEMAGVYAAFILFLWSAWRWRRRPELWTVLIFCGGMMLIYSLTTCNVGTLYRVRYAFIMTLVAVGLAAPAARRAEARGVYADKRTNHACATD